MSKPDFRNLFALLSRHDQKLTAGEIQRMILQDAMARDLTTARRSVLLLLIWNERFLTREQLIARIELKLGRNCFGRTA